MCVCVCVCVCPLNLIHPSLVSSDATRRLGVTLACFMLSFCDVCFCIHLCLPVCSYHQQFLPAGVAVVIVARDTVVAVVAIINIFFIITIVVVIVMS